MYGTQVGEISKATIGHLPMSKKDSVHVTLKYRHRIRICLSNLQNQSITKQFHIYVRFIADTNNKKTPQIEAFFLNLSCKIILRQSHPPLSQFRKQKVDDGKSRRAKSGMFQYAQFRESTLNDPK